MNSLIYWIRGNVISEVKNSSAVKHFVWMSDLLQMAVQRVFVHLWKAILLQPQDHLRFLVRLEGQQVHEALTQRPVLRHAFLQRTAGDEDWSRRPPWRCDIGEGRCRFPDLHLLAWEMIQGWKSTQRRRRRRKHHVQTKKAAQFLFKKSLPIYKQKEFSMLY